MEQFDQILTLLAEKDTIGWNSNLLETGLFNILALVGILIYAGKDFLGSILEERKSTILKEVKDAENRLKEAEKRLQEAEKQFSQANLVLSEIQQETIATKKVLLNSDAQEAKKDLKLRFERALSTFQSQERSLLIDMKQQILSLVLQRTLTRLKETFRQPERATAFLTETINQLEGELS